MSTSPTPTPSEAKVELVDLRARVLAGHEPTIEETRRAIELLQISRGHDLNGSKLKTKAEAAKIDLDSLFT